ncbi:MAG: TraR/DksA C4-type zinc finger protein [Candidatus Binatia bacterium]|nr:TraR/DksA C4-type zinc finger protein [Candidatus Binatia bacterium]
MDELTAAQRQELAELLHALDAELVQALELAAEGTATVELDQQSVGRLSRMDEMQRQAVAKSGRRSLELRLQQVRAALVGISRDEYGDCRACEEPIGFPRLKARPETPFCLECQGAREGKRR